MLNFKEFLEKIDEQTTSLATAILPSVSKASQIRMIERNKNPIYILLADGTQLYLSWDEFKRIRGKEPEPGRKLTVVFQRNEGDRSKSPSQINNIICH